MWRVPARLGIASSWHGITSSVLTPSIFVASIFVSSIFASVLFQEIFQENLALASDISEALLFAEDVVGEEITAGYESFVDYDMEEALPLLLARDLVPIEPDSIDLDEDLKPMQRSEHFERLGAVRLSFAKLRSVIEEASAETGLPMALIDAVIRTESGYRPQALSRAGAVGLMQLMPKTARDLGVEDPFDPRANVIGGARYLRKMIDRFGSLRLAVAAYNAGPKLVAKNRAVPNIVETRRYVDVVLRRFQSARVAGIK